MRITEVNMIYQCAEALEKLTTIFQEGERPSFREAIERRLDVFSLWLKKEENKLISSDLEDFLSRASATSTNTQNPSFQFAATLLGLLTCLRRSLELVRAQVVPCGHPLVEGLPVDGPGEVRRPPSAAPLAADVLSVRQQRLAARSVQMALVLTVLPALPRGVGVPLQERSEFADDIRGMTSAAGNHFQRRDQALFALGHLLPLIGDRSLRDAVVTSHLGDVIALLLLVTSAPLARDGVAGMTPDRRRVMESQRELWRPQLQSLLDSLPQSRVVTELLVLQRCALGTSPPRRWMHERCTWWLFRVVGRPGGLARVTEGLLQFWGQDQLDHVDDSRIQAVARMLVSPHPAYRTADYFSHLATEVLALLRIPRTEVRASTLRVAGALTACLWDSGEATDSVQQQIINPLMGFLLTDGDVTEEDVTCGVTSAWQLFVVGMEPSRGCLSGLMPFAGALFQLYTAIHGGVSHLKTAVRELLGRLVRHLGVGADLLDQLLLAQGLGDGRRFAAGGTGGVAVESVPEDEADNWLLDDDSAAEAFATVLCSAGESEVVAGVFRTLLERLGDVMKLSLPVPPKQIGSHGPEQTLRNWETEMVANHQSFRHGLLTLRALAALAESEQARTALDDPARLLPIIGTLLETFSLLPGNADGSVLRVETVCLAMGVAAGMLGRESTTSVVWETARTLLPALGALQDDSGGVARVRDMARDLRQLVLTNGVVNHDMVGQDRYGVHRAAERLPGSIKTEPGTRPNTEEDQSKPVPSVDASRGESSSLKPDPDLDTTCGSGDASLPCRVPPLSPSDPAAHGTCVTYEKAMYDLVDPLLPVRAHALTALTQLLQRRDPETWRHRKHLLRVFQEKLSDDDSYVYLAAVRGVACLADLCTDQLVEGLCAQYTGAERDAETRLKLGEALIVMVSNLGELAPRYRAPLLNAFLRGARDSDHLLRASSLSNLAQLCRLLRYALSNAVHEIFGCVSALVDTDPAVEVRRAAVLVLAQLLDGLGRDALKVLEEVLSPLYRKLKSLLGREEDPAMLHHVHTALDKLEVATRAVLFPERKLEKHITVVGLP